MNGCARRGFPSRVRSGAGIARHSRCARDTPGSRHAGKMTARVQVMDSHTGGEPTRVVIDGGQCSATEPSRKNGTRFAPTIIVFARAWSRSRAVPRSWWGAAGPPTEPTAVAGGNLFQQRRLSPNVRTRNDRRDRHLAQLGRIAPGAHRVETPAGTVTAKLHDDGAVSIENVPSWRTVKKYVVATAQHGDVAGDMRGAATGSF